MDGFVRCYDSRRKSKDDEKMVANEASMALHVPPHTE
jgi:hypothetical protein